MNDDPKRAARPEPPWRLGLAAIADCPRCGARCRTRGGEPCRSPAMANGRCRMHGGKAGGPEGERNGAWKHGHRSKRAKNQARQLRAGLALVDVLMGRLSRRR